MNISDSFSTYFSAVTLNPDLSTTTAIENHIKENSQKFTYGNVSYQIYKDLHQFRGFVERKVIAIPSALVAGAAKSIFHLARGIFYGLPKALEGNSVCLQADIYRLVRDAEEALGWIITLFHDTLGSYLVQDSLFQKECYSYFEKQHTPVDIRSWYYSRTIINGIEIPHSDEAFLITLRDFRQMSENDQQAVITKFQLQSTIDAIGHENFFQQLSGANEQVLDLVNLVDLKTNALHSKLKFVLLSDDEFKKLSLGQLEDVSDSQMQIISHRIKLIENEARENIVLPENILELTLVDFHSIKGSKINECILEIPPSIFRFISDEQLLTLDFAKASADQIQNLFSNRSSTSEDKRRFALLSPDQANDALPKLSQYQMYLLSDTHLNGLKIADLADKPLQLLFSNRSSTSEDKRRMALVRLEQIKKVLNRLTEYQVKLMPAE